MFRHYNKECRKTKAHRPHYWSGGFLWTDFIWCGGVKLKSAWEKANPDLTSNRIVAEGGVPYCDASGKRIYKCGDQNCNECKNAKPKHRCFYKLVKCVIIGLGRRYATPAPAYKTRYYWQCQCGKFEIKDKIDFREEMLPDRWKNLEQTWPS